MNKYKIEYTLSESVVDESTSSLVNKDSIHEAFVAGEDRTQARDRFFNWFPEVDFIDSMKLVK